MMKLSQWISQFAGAVPSDTAGVVPIGAIVAWHKTLIGVPALPAAFVLCSGGNVADPDSPINGQAIPDLNHNKRFIRGNTTSGTTSGSETHSHGVVGGTEIEDGDTDVQASGDSPATVAALGHVHSFTAQSDTANHLPPYFEAVWIMRIK